MLEVSRFFQRHFGHTPTHCVQAPGRIELLGNHTDYNDGLVMALAIDKHVSVAASPRTDGKVALVSSAFDEREQFFVSDLKKNPKASWTDYVKGILDQFRRRGMNFRGFNAAFHSTLPMGAGLASSGALLVAVALMARKLWPFALGPAGAMAAPRPNAAGELPPPTSQEMIGLARLCQAAEDQFVGVRCGLMDYMSSLFGKTLHAIEIDCQSLSVEWVPLPGEVSFVLCETGVKHALVGGEYNELRQQCDAAAGALGVKSLRSVEPKMLAANRTRLTEREHACAYHVVGEVQRVLFGARALRQGDVEQFGQFMYQSHESSRDFLRNSCAELDCLVDLARAHPACLGARLTGGGFGGATISLVTRPQAPAFCEAIGKAYEQRAHRPLHPMVCQAGDGAR